MNILSLPIDVRKKVRKDPRLIVALAELPAPAATLILDVIQKTRLWRREKVEVAEELVAHFADGLEAGRSADDLVATFGDSKLAAKLIRRAKKRKRPRWWRISRRFVQSIVWFVVLWCVASLLLATRHATIRVDYVAELNRQLPAAPPDQQAWPIYRAAMLADPLSGVPIFDMKQGDNGRLLDPCLCETRPGDEDWSKVVALLDEHRALVVAVRAGGTKRILGLPALPGGAYSSDDRLALEISTDAPAWGWLNSVRQDQSRHPLHTLFWLLVMDSWRAANEGDGARVVENYHSLVVMARQVAERRFWISNEMATDILWIGGENLGAIETKYPSLLDGRRAALIHEMSAASDVFAYDLSSERMYVLDVIQRTFSDNGSGNGMLTYEGIRLIDNNFAPPVPRTCSWFDERQLLVAALPASATLGVSRKEITRKANLYFDTADRESRQPMWVRMKNGSATEQLTEDWHTEINTLRNLPVSTTLWSIKNLLKRRDQSLAVHEATMAGLGLSAYREANGDYPQTLDQLAPQYLAQLPVDHSSGLPLKYKLQNRRPLLWGLGTNGTDEGGIWTGSVEQWPDLPPRGDWVLYPPIRRY